jgi:hypothetical protein
MTIKDRYFVELVAKPALLFFVDYSLYGFFETKAELSSYLQAFASKMQGVSEMQMKITDEESKEILEVLHFSMQGKKGKLGDSELIDFLNPEENMLFINKYLDLQDIKRTHEHYLADFAMQRPTHKDSVVLAFFSSISEFVRILSCLSKKLKDESNLQFTIDHLDGFKRRLSSRAYKVFENAVLLVPEMEKHYIDLKDIKDRQLLSLYLWENDFTDKVIKK